MKKLVLTALLAVCSITMAADVLVYDYKASIKRLDLQVKYVKAKGVAQQFNVVSDTVAGYVVLPACNSCSADSGITATTATDEFNGYAYLVLKGNKFAKQVGRYVYKAPVYATAAVFGSQAYTTDSDPANPKQNKKAWMALDYAMAEVGEIQPDFDVTPLLKGKVNATNEPQYIGFLGLGHFGNDGVLVQNTGFGTAKVVTTSDPDVFDFCGGYAEGKDYNCTIVNTINGTLVGYPKYIGPCGHLPMWDLCVETLDSGDLYYMMTGDAVISGTWSLKFNNKLTKAARAADNAEDVILKKIGVDATQMYTVEEH